MRTRKLYQLNEPQDIIMTTISVKVKNSSQNYTRKFLVYDAFYFDENDQLYQDMVSKTVADLTIDPDAAMEPLDVTVKVTT